MKMAADLEKAFIKQITKEYESAMLYRQLAIELELMDLPGISKWLKNHADEELTHADKLIKHLTDRDNHPVIGDIKTPKVKVTSVTETFDVALEAEREVSESIRELYFAADEARDIDSRSLLDWFVSEQIEEEAVVSEILGRARMVNEDGSGILRLDAELEREAQVDDVLVGHRGQAELGVGQVDALARLEQAADDHRAAQRLALDRDDAAGGVHRSQL